HNVSRAKLAYLIDATAAPVCIIAPVSSWAAAVTSSVPEGSDINGFSMFLKTIPYNFYALTTLLMIVLITVLKADFGLMKTHEANAIKGDLFTTAARPYGDADEEPVTPHGKVIDLVFPVIVLIVCCIIGMIYTGGFFEGESFINAFSNADASMGLVLGSLVTLIITFCFYMTRGVLTFKEFTECIPEGFKAMVAPILILTMAWTLSGMTGLLGAKYYVHDIVASSAGALKLFLPCIIFIVALFLAFSTGTSWGTFAILIPIVCNVFGDGETGEMLVISIAACLSGAVCGDHCSPISDTTIMASAGAHSDHVNHVSTQLPYALTAAAVSFVGYIIAGTIGYFTESSLALIALPVTLALMVITIFVIKKITQGKMTVQE
ncbi:MAG: Na+/H+ antiporter NhaC family protein, partial [Thermoflexaceae bacterium]|nr:Na+/H+ antiporter NhaC family protein [Thermoflexaceae bacterium]